jgi:small subunit ribosomal protein S2
MEIPKMRDLLEAGVHFGHQVKRWNPKMASYIFTAKDGIHVLDLAITVAELEKACEFLKNVSADGGKVIFLGTKRQAQPIIREEAERAGAMYVVNRWIGGLLTNFESVSQRIVRLSDLESKREAGEFKNLTKKEQLLIDREIEKLNRLYGGVRGLDKLPDALFVVDVRREINAVREAQKRGVPVVAICDTNADPDYVDWVIPGNDDAIKSIKILVSAASDAVLEGKGVWEKKKVEGSVKMAKNREEAEGLSEKEAEKTEGEEAVSKVESKKPKIKKVVKAKPEVIKEKKTPLKL